MSTEIRSFPSSVPGPLATSAMKLLDEAYADGRVAFTWITTVDEKPGEGKKLKSAILIRPSADSKWSFATFGDKNLDVAQDWDMGFQIRKVF